MMVLGRKGLLMGERRASLGASLERRCYPSHIILMILVMWLAVRRTQLSI